MTEKSTVRAEVQNTRPEFLDWNVDEETNEDDTSGLSAYEIRKQLTRMEAAQTTTEDSGVHKRSDIGEVESAQLEEWKVADQSHISKIDTYLEATAKQFGWNTAQQNEVRQVMLASEELSQFPNLDNLSKRTINSFSKIMHAIGEQYITGSKRFVTSEVAEVDPIPTATSVSTDTVVTPTATEDVFKLNIVFPEAESIAFPQFGSFIGYDEARKHAALTCFLTSTNEQVSTVVDKCQESTGPDCSTNLVEAAESVQTVTVNSTAEQAEAAAPVDFDIAFDHSALMPETEEAVEAASREELEMEIAREFGDDAESVNKKQKAKLIGLIHHYNNAAERTYIDQRATKKNSNTPSRLTNLWNYVKNPIKGMVGVIAPNYALKRNDYENHLAYPVTAKVEAKNRLEADIQSISDSYEVLADYVQIKFGEDFAFNVDNNKEVDRFLNDCLNTPDSPHYKAIMAQTQDKVKERMAQYNAEIAKIDEEINGIDPKTGKNEYKETTNEILASSMMIRIKKGVSDTFSDLKLDIKDAWARIVGKKPSVAKAPEWTKREIPTVLGAAVSFRADHQAYMKDATETEAVKVEKKIVKDGKNGKRAGFLLTAAAVVAGFIGGGLLIKKAVDGSMNEGAKGALTGTAKAPDKTTSSKVAANNTTNSVNIANAVNSGKDSGKTPTNSEKPGKVAVKLTPAKATASLPLGGSKAAKTGPEKPKLEKVEQKIEQKEVGDMPLSEGMKMEEITFGNKKLAIYSAAMKEITLPVIGFDGKKVPYSPDLLAFNTVLDSIGRAHLTLKTRKDVIALHALYASADKKIGEYQIARDRLVVPGFVAETDMNVGMARKSLDNIKALLAGREGKFQIVVPVKVAGTAEVNRVHDINLADIERDLAVVDAESHSRLIPSQKRAVWMAESSKYSRTTLEFAEWYLAKDASKVRF